MTSEKVKQYKREWMKKWREENPQKERNLQKISAKRYKEKYPEKVRENVKRCVSNWRKKYPERNKAHRVVYNALRNKTLVKGKCFCGEEKVQAHHKDYSKPLDVEWVCKIHHTLADKIRKVHH